MTTLSGIKGAARPGGASRRARERRAPSARFVRWTTTDLPWDVADLFQLIWLGAVGPVAIAVGWYGSSGEANFHRQVLWLAACIGGVMISAFGMVGWLLAGLRNVHREAFDVVRIIRAERLHQEFALDDLDSVARTSGPDSDGYVIGASMTRVHHRDCPLVRGRPVSAISDMDIARLSLAMCGVCAQ